MKSCSHENHPTIDQLKAYLDENPSSLEIRSDLIEYYFDHIVRSWPQTDRRIIKAWVSQVMWVISNHPASKTAGQVKVKLRPFGPNKEFNRGKKLWIQQAKVHPNNPMILANASRYIASWNPKVSLALMERAHAMAPQDANIAENLLHIYLRECSSTDAAAKYSKHACARKAYSLIEVALKGPQKERFYRLSDVAEAAYHAEEYEVARTYAIELINDASNYRDNWNYGNAIFNGNIVLGRTALQIGDVASAITHLLEAGKTPGSPQLNSFGPKFTLAKDLYKLGQLDTVRSYLDLCGNFWEMGQEVLKRWREDMEAGREPDFDIRF